MRWVVEGYHGRIQKWRFLAHVQPVYWLESLGDLVRIVTAACNAYRSPLLTSSDADTSVAEAMLKKSQEKTNLVFDRVTKHKLQQRQGSKKWSLFDLELQDDEYTSLTKKLSLLTTFPKLTVETLQTDIIMGTYQLKQAKSYTAEHMGK